MGTHNTSGFTIIETMLVLAITGVMIAGIFIGVGTSINIQRYRDSVETFKTVIQSQYAELSSVRNDRANDWSCDGQAATAQDGAIVRGQSDCILVGRLLAVNGGQYRIYSVLGREIANPSGTSDDLAALRDDYNLNVSNVDIETGVLEWGAEIAWPSSGSGAQTPTTPREIAILFIRSPDSGQLYTFSGNQSPETITPSLLDSLIVAGNSIPGQSERTICISSDGAVINDDRSIFISAFAAVPNAIETRTNDLIAGLGSTTRC